MESHINSLDGKSNRFNSLQNLRKLVKLEGRVNTLVARCVKDDIQVSVEFEQVTLSIEQIEATSTPNIQQLIKEREIMEQATFQEQDMALQIMADWFDMSKEEVNKALHVWVKDREYPTRVERRSWECIARNNNVSVRELKKAVGDALKVHIVAVPGMGNRYYKRNETTGEILGDTSPTKIGAGHFSLKELEEDFPELRPFVVSHITCSN